MTHTRHSGFTLIELMVAVLVGVIVVAGIYTMYTSSTRGYRIQNQSLHAMGQLRLASQHIRADLRRAAYNAPAQSSVESWVVPPTGQNLAAVVVEADPNSPVVEPALNDDISPQRIRLLGDFWGRRPYTVERITGTTVELRWGPQDGGEAEFQRVFTDTRMLRIEGFGTARQEEIIRIQSVDWNSAEPRITLQQPVSTISGFGTGAEATVLGYIRYRLMQDNRREGDSVKYDLVREELDLAGNTVDGTVLIVAENIVDMQVYDVCFNATPPDAEMRQVPVNIQCQSDLQAVQNAANVSLQPGLTNTSHLLRAVTVKLAARTPFEDPDVQFAARGSLNEPLRTYELDPQLEGAARVFELATTVTLTSVQARRM
ncbi:MAG: PilW family protein [Myxococcota bacterium]